MVAHSVEESEKGSLLTGGVINGTYLVGCSLHSTYKNRIHKNKKQNTECLVSAKVVLKRMHLDVELFSLGSCGFFCDWGNDYVVWLLTTFYIQVQVHVHSLISSFTLTFHSTSFSL